QRWLWWMLSKKKKERKQPRGSNVSVGNLGFNPSDKPIKYTIFGSNNIRKTYDNPITGKTC
ncbi:hypothetical protein N9F69_04485, partial [Flavobacteriaceae bacterium]|nr:hypothetical protein [Flavobacteriaceae bacterium]